MIEIAIFYGRNLPALLHHWNGVICLETGILY